MNRTRWVRVVGDGTVFSGPCILHHILIYPHSDTQYVDVYDGRDAVAGKHFARLEILWQHSHHYNFSPGIPFDVGIYIDSENVAEETTVVFTPE